MVELIFIRKSLHRIADIWRLFSYASKIKISCGNHIMYCGPGNFREFINELNIIWITHVS